MLVALAFMPLSMVGSQAATPVDGVGHCSDHQKPAENPAVPKAHCAACAALPALTAPAAPEEIRPAIPLIVEADHWATAQAPEIATPPPKMG